MTTPNGAQSGASRTVGQVITDRFATHLLKVVDPYFKPLLDGDKTFEVRLNDRAYQRGDLLILNEWHDANAAGRDTLCGACRHEQLCGNRGHWTSRKVHRWVTFVFTGDPRFGGVEAGHVVLGLAPATDVDPDAYGDSVAGDGT